MKHTTMILQVAATISALGSCSSTLAFAPTQRSLIHKTTRHLRPEVIGSSSMANTALRASAEPILAPLSPSNLAVSIDKPLLTPIEYGYRASSPTNIWRSFLAVLLSDVFKTAMVAFLIAAGVTLLSK